MNPRDRLAPGARRASIDCRNRRDLPHMPCRASSMATRPFPHRHPRDRRREGLSTRRPRLTSAPLRSLVNATWYARHQRSPSHGGRCRPTRQPGESGHRACVPVSVPRSFYRQGGAALVRSLLRNDGAVVRLWLNRPEKENILNYSLHAHSPSLPDISLIRVGRHRTAKQRHSREVLEARDRREVLGRLLPNRSLLVGVMNLHRSCSRSPGRSSPSVSGSASMGGIELGPGVRPDRRLLDCDAGDAHPAGVRGGADP